MITAGIHRFEINRKSGGDITLGRPLGATGVRLSLTVTCKHSRSGGRRGIVSASIGAGRSVAVLVQLPA